MLQGSPSSSLPFIHQQGLALLKGTYTSQEDASAKITSGLDNFYSTKYPAVWSSQRALVDQAAKTLTTIYSNNVFPYMKVVWGSHPNNLDHNNYAGCFRCHDGSHTAKNGKTITNDCTTCHNLTAFDELKPAALVDIGGQ
jgi:formate-dependent nitrite reductase cytochrome c552 subunit